MEGLPAIDGDPMRAALPIVRPLGLPGEADEEGEGPPPMKGPPQPLLGDEGLRPAGPQAPRWRGEEPLGGERLLWGLEGEREEEGEGCPAGPVVWLRWLRGMALRGLC